MIFHLNTREVDIVQRRNLCQSQGKKSGSLAIKFVVSSILMIRRHSFLTHLPLVFEKVANKTSIGIQFAQNFHQNTVFQQLSSQFTLKIDKDLNITKPYKSIYYFSFLF